jgi:hypothetical protein
MLGWSFGFYQNSRQTRRDEIQGEFSLRHLEEGEHSSGTTGMKQATAVSGNVLVVAGLEAEDVAELVIASAEALGGD